MWKEVLNDLNIKVVYVYSWTVELRISFNLKTRLALIRFWYRDKLVGEQPVKTEDLKKVHFWSFNSALLKFSQQVKLFRRRTVFSIPEPGEGGVDK